MKKKNEFLGLFYIPGTPGYFKRKEKKNLIYDSNGNVIKKTGLFQAIKDLLKARIK